MPHESGEGGREGGAHAGTNVEGTFRPLCAARATALPLAAPLLQLLYCTGVPPQRDFFGRFFYREKGAEGGLWWDYPSLQQTSDSSLILSLSLFLSPFSLSLSPLSPLSLSLFCRPVCAARQPSKGSTPSARSHTRACTAQIGWRATRSWKGLSLGAGLWRRASRM